MKLRFGVTAPPQLEVIIRQAEHLVRLVDDLLELSRVVAQAVEATGPLFEKMQHRLSLQVPSSGLMIEADEVRLTQVVSNLLTNAARYTPPGGSIEVSAARNEEEIVLSVRDNGN